MSLEIKHVASPKNTAYQPVRYQPVRKAGFGCVECDSFVSTQKQAANSSPQLTFGQKFVAAAQTVSQKFAEQNPAEIGKKLGNAIYGTNVK